MTSVVVVMATEPRLADIQGWEGAQTRLVKICKKTTLTTDDFETIACRVEDIAKPKVVETAAHQAQDTNVIILYSKTTDSVRHKEQIEANKPKETCKPFNFDSWDSWVSLYSKATNFFRHKEQFASANRRKTYGPFHSWVSKLQEKLLDKMPQGLGQCAKDRVSCIDITSWPKGEIYSSKLLDQKMQVGFSDNLETATERKPRRTQILPYCETEKPPVHAVQPYAVQPYAVPPCTGQSESNKGIEQPLLEKDTKKTRQDSYCCTCY